MRRYWTVIGLVAPAVYGVRLYSQGMAFLSSPAAEYGDWYARRMYERGGAQYKYHVQAYGHPSKFGFVLARLSPFPTAPKVAFHGHSAGGM